MTTPLEHPAAPYHFTATDLLLLAAGTLLALAVHGYHLGSDDAAIYVPAIKRVADPQLFPFNGQFFLRHAHLSLFPELIGAASRLTRLPVDWAIFIWYAICLFLLLAAARQLSSLCFKSRRAQWGGVALLAALLTVPVAGTALVIMDPYVTARCLSTPATLFAVTAFAARRYRRGLLWLLLTALIHPQMSFYGGAFLFCLLLAPHFARVKPSTLAPALASLAVLPGSFDFQPARGVYREVLFSRSYFFVSRWEWYEWLGAAAPLLFFWWFSRRYAAGTLPPFRRLSQALLNFGLIFTAAAILLSTTARLDSFQRLQPMRGFHLIYIVFFVFIGGFLGEHVLRNQAWRWCCCFLPLAAGMWTGQALTYPSSAHIEWPGAAYRAGWPSAFVWIRGHTPKDARFALDPHYMAIPGDDQHGFRALAERSVLADNLKDSGAVSLFPDLADSWKQQTSAQAGWKDFQLADFRRLQRDYGVDWLVLQRAPPIPGLPCPYQNVSVRVCRLPLAER